MNVIEKNLIFLDTELDSQDEIFQFLANTVVDLGRGKSVEGIVEGFYFREKEFSTAMNDRIAIPHCRNKYIQQASVVVLRNKKNVVWTNQEKVNLIFALLVPESNENQMHIRVLAQVAQMIMEDNFIEMITTADNSEYVFEKMKDLNLTLNQK